MRGRRLRRPGRRREPDPPAPSGQPEDGAVERREDGGAERREDGGADRREDGGFGQPAPIDFTGPERRARPDRRAVHDRRTGRPDRRLIRRERRRSGTDRRSGADRRLRAGIVLTEATTHGAGVPLAPVARSGKAAVHRRRRLAAALVAAVVAAAVAVALALSLGGGAGPAEAAANVVPGDALALVHLSTDGQRPATRAGLRLVERLPDYPILSALLEQRLGQLLSGGKVVDFVSQVRPWLGREAALAVLAGAGATANTLIVLDVRNHTRARSFLARQGVSADGTYRGTPLLSYPTGTELAFVSHFLVLGQPGSVRAAVEVARGATPSLASTGSYQAASRGEPASRFLDAYASPAGVRRLLEGQSGLIAALGVLLDNPALSGVSFSLSASPTGARIVIFRALDRSLVKLNPSSQQPFSPSLQSLIPPTALGLLELRGLDRSAGRLLGIGSGTGVGGQIGSLVSRLGSALVAEGINVSDVTSLFNRQTALALVEPQGRSGVSPSPVLLTRTDDPARARTELAALEAPLASLFPPPSAGPGRAATFSDVSVDGVTAHQLVLNPGLQFDYAVFRGLVVVSTSLDGIRQIIRPHGSISATTAYTRSLPSLPSQVTSLLFLDFSQLLSIGEQTGLLRGARLSALQKDLGRIRTIGLVSTGGEADTTAELSLQIP